MSSGTDATSPTVIYTDGACSGNPGPGGWAWAIPDGPSASGADAQTTNQRMELTAVLRALDANPGPVEIVSDSTYVVKCFNDRWYDGWLRRNWRNANKKPVANRDLWEPVVEHFQRRAQELTFTWVKGHSGNKLNDLVDAMAVAEVDAIKGKAGDRLVNEMAELDVPWPNDRAVIILGARQLSSDEAAWLRRTVGALDPAKDVVVSGLRRGTELFGAEQALAHNVPLAVVLPFADPAGAWPEPQRQRFDVAHRMATWIIDLEQPRTNLAKALDARMHYLSRAATGVIVVNDDDAAATLDQAGLSVIRWAGGSGDSNANANNAVD